MANIKRLIYKLLSKNTIKNWILMILMFLVFTPFIFAQTSQSTDNSFTTGDNLLDCNLNGLAIRAGGTMFVQSNASGNSGLGMVCAGKPKSLTQADPNLATKLKSLNINPDTYGTPGAIGLLAQAGNYAYSGASQNGPDAVTYVANAVNPNKVAAQSSALQGLSPILILWGTLRNVTYILIALSLVVTGLTMYFKSKQGKQDNFNIATSIADIIFTLVSITLSYVVAGIAVDLVINVGNVAVATFFQPFINSTSILNNLYTPGTNTNILTILGDFQRNGSSGSIVNVAQQGLQYLNLPIDQTANFVQSAVSVPVVDIFFKALASVIFGLAKGAATQSVNSPLIAAILAFTVFIIIFRIVFLLLGSFVGIVMIIAFSPLILIPGAFPGPSAGQVFTDWIKKVLSYAIVFPLMFAMMLLAAIFLNLGDKATNSEGCVYDNTLGTPVQITSTDANNQSDIFKTTRFQDNTNSSATSNDSYSNIRRCFPILLPPKFNWMPAPIGNLGSSFEIDDFTRYVVGIAIIIIAPNITKAIQDALKIKQSPLATTKDALAGAGIFNTFIGQVPLIGKPLSQITSGITGALK